MSIEGILKDVEAYMGTATLIHLRVIPATCRPKKSLDAPLYAFGHLGSFLVVVLKALVIWRASPFVRRCRWVLRTILRT